jgi:hypothetical protein
MDAIRISIPHFVIVWAKFDRLCGLVVRVLGYRFGGPSSIPDLLKKKKKENN